MLKLKFKINEYEKQAADLLKSVLNIFNDNLNWKLDIQYELDKIAQDIEFNLAPVVSYSQEELNKVSIFTKQFDKIGKVFIRFLSTFFSVRYLSQSKKHYTNEKIFLRVKTF